MRLEFILDHRVIYLEANEAPEVWDAWNACKAIEDAGSTQKLKANSNLYEVSYASLEALNLIREDEGIWCIGLEGWQNNNK